ncbi:hypothetical protein ACB098_04G141200 [Castanea mollissima]
MSALETKASIPINPSPSKYSVNFSGKTTETIVTDKASKADEWVQQIISTYAGTSTVVGLDTEWSPHPSKRAAVLQLCMDEKCLIVQFFYMDSIPQSLKNFLMDSNFTFVGIGVARDIAKLKNEYELECSKSMDIVGLEMRKPKDVCMSNWETRLLNEAQIEYACIDAYASYKIGHKLLMEE